MGVIKGVTSAVGGVVADQWEEYFYCDSLDADVLVTKGHKRQKGRGAGNNKGEDNIISNGSVKQPRIREFISLIQRRLWGINTEQPIRYRSVL